MSNMKTMKRGEIGAFTKALRDEFARQLGQFGPKALSKKAKADLEAGFADGSRSMLNALERAGYLSVDRSEAPGAVTPVEPKPTPVPEGPMRAIGKDGVEVLPATTIVDFRGDKATFVRAVRRNWQGGQGKVAVEIGGVERVFNANVYGLEVR